MRIGLLAAFAALSGAAAWAQGSSEVPGDISVTLRVANGRTQFRLGEIVPVELVFASRTVGRYQVWAVPTRQIMYQEYDRFSVEPDAGVRVDPPLVIFAYNGFGYNPVALEGSPVTVSLTLNDWTAFRAPGHYRIAVETRRVLAGQAATPLTLKSNAIEIEEVRPEPAWAETQVSRASAILRGELRRSDPNEAARTLRFLGTLDAANALVRFHLYGPPDVQNELVKGLCESPYQQEIIQELEEAFATPDLRIVQPRQVRSTLDELKFIASKRNRP